MSHQPVVLLFGLPPDHPSVPPHVRSQLEALEGQMLQKGVNFKLVGVTTDQNIDELRHTLSGYTPPVDAVVIGNGIRSVGDYTVLFEQLVNVVRECTPAAKLLFNRTPGDTIDAVRRWFQLD